MEMALPVRQRQRPIPQLPPELAPIILAQAPDATTLRNLVLSASCFHKGFFSAPSRILQAVLLNEFGTNVLPEALAMYKSLHLPKAGFEKAREDFIASLVPSSAVPAEWTLSDSLSLTRIHRDVCWFASEFVETFTEPSNEIVVRDCNPLTRREIDRVRGALFRFQLFLNLFPKGQYRSDSDGRKGLFLDKFAPWENEQLATVYEFLLSRLSLAFDDVASHDVLWGKHIIPSSKERSPPYNTFKEHCLSLGLSWLRKVATASTYDERYRIIIPETGEQEPDYLYKTLTEPYDVFKDVIDLKDVLDDDLFKYVSPHFIHDSDGGPFLAWRWAHATSSAAYTYATRELTSLRATGYVMIDQDRVQRRYRLNEPKELVISYDMYDMDSNRRIRQAVKESRRKRCEIYDAGGRGYWHESDESKLIWNVPKLGAGVELFLGGEPYRDYWQDGILVDRARVDDYMVHELF